MVIRVQIKGVKRFQKFSINLTKEMDKEIMKAGMRFNRFVQKSAKLRAPRMTGRLAESITVKRKGKQIILRVESPYGRFQDEGFAPHWIHSDMSDRMGGTVGGLMGKEGFFFVTKHTPFITPALKMGIARLPEMVSHGTKKAIRKAGR